MKRILVIVAALVGLALFGPAIGNLSKSLANWDFSWGGSGGSANVATTTAPQEPCLGTLCTITLMPGEEKVVNPKGYYFYSKTDKGVIVLSGPNGEKEAGKKGPGYQDGFIIRSVRAKGSTAEMRYILCPNPKSDMNQLNCV